MKLRSFLSLLIIIIVPALLHGQTDLKFKQKILISSAGQSADTKLAGMVMKRLKLDSKENNSATASDLSGIQTLIIVPGFSSKGLGAAGISYDQEMQRVKELVAAAKKEKIPIICLHIGGNARRKGQSDSFNQLVAESSKAIIVVKQGDEDKFFSNIANSKKIPIKVVEKISGISDPLKEFFD